VSEGIVSIIIDAAHIEKTTSDVIDAVDECGFGHDFLGTYFGDAMRRSVVFWAPLIIALKEVVPAGHVCALRTFIFDATYADSDMDVLNPSGDVSHQQRSRTYARAIQRQAAYALVPEDFFPADVLGSPPGSPQVAATVTIGVPNQGEHEMGFLYPGVSLVRSALHVPDQPGLYLGHLSIDRDESKMMSQKAVDSMATVCMVLEALNGHRVLLYAEDTDFIPAAAPSLLRGQDFHLCCFRGPPKHWKLAKRVYPQLQFHMAKVPVPVPRSWGAEKVEHARMRVAESLRLPESSVFPFVLDIPLMDVKLLDELKRWSPTKLRLRSRMKEP